MNKIYKISKHVLSVCHRNCNTCWTKLNYGPMEVQRCMLLNGVSVVAAKTSGGQIAVCTIMYQVRNQPIHVNVLVTNPKPLESHAFWIIRSAS